MHTTLTLDMQFKTPIDDNDKLKISTGLKVS